MVKWSEVVYSFLILFLVAGLMLFVYIGYLLIWRRLKYRHIPGPPLAHVIKGHAGDMLKKIADGFPLDEYLLDCHKSYGNVVLIWLYHEPLLSVTSPAMVKETLVLNRFPKSSKLFQCGVRLFGARLAGHGLITNFDHENWMKRRELMNPAFHRRYLRNLVPIFNSCCKRLERKLESSANGVTKVRFLDELGLVTLDVMCLAGYGKDFDIVNNPNSQFPKAFNLTMEGMEMFAFNPFHQLDVRTFKFQREVIEACRFLRKTGNEMITQRRQDLLNGVDVPNDILTFILKSADKATDLSDEDLIDEFVTFFYAGHETTARTLAFCLMELAFYPEVKAKLLEEIANVLGERDDDVTFENLPKLEYTWFCIRETLRLYPIAAGIRRYIDKPSILNGIKIPGKTDLYVSSYVSARHPDHFDHPEEFIPERWASHDIVTSSGLTSFPFSVGYRTCIGQTFAQIESKILLARILRKFSIQLVPGHTKKITQRITIQPREGIECSLKRRI
nr:CYP2 [Erythropodium caribaeorum]